MYGMSTVCDAPPIAPPAPTKITDLAGLTLAMRAVESRSRAGAVRAPVRLGWTPLGLGDGQHVTGSGDASCADRLQWGGIHEWIAPDGAALCLLIHAARRVRDADALRSDREHRARSVVWIGRSSWPCPHACGGVGNGLLARSVWIDPPDRASRLWAIDMALRCGGVCAVVADGGGLDLAATRRLQLAAETGGTIGLIARPEQERTSLSAAATRWLVTPAPTHGNRPRWTVELVRCKGVQPARGDPRRFLVERDHAGNLVVPPELAHRSDAAAGSIGAAPVRAAA